MKISYILLLFAIYSHSQAEIRDTKVALLKATIVSNLGVETALKIMQSDLLNDLKKEEDRYDDKRGPLSNVNNSIVVLTTGEILNQISSDIARVVRNIGIRKLAKFGLFHGLSRFEDNINKEKEYYNRLIADFNLQNSGILLSGGAGYNYVGYLKVLKRAIALKKRVLQIDKDVKILMTVSRILAR